jgi:hypothetical protein
MFLTRGDMPHERTWAAWLKSAEGQIPVDDITKTSLCRSQADSCHGESGWGPTLVRVLLKFKRVHLHRSCFYACCGLSGTMQVDCGLTMMQSLTCSDACMI